LSEYGWNESVLPPRAAQRPDLADLSDGELMTLPEATTLLFWPRGRAVGVEPEERREGGAVRRRSCPTLMTLNQGSPKWTTVSGSAAAILGNRCGAIAAV
jgi:hypothetical protein